MIARSRRRVALVVLAAAVALGASACGTSTTDNAATVEYHDATGAHTVNITNSEFRSQLADLVGNQQFQQLVAQQQFKGDGKNSTDPRIAAIYLGQLINQVPIDAAFDRLHLTVSPQNTSDAETAVKSEFALQSEVDQSGNLKPGAGAVFNAFPKSFQNLLIQRAARQQAVAQYYSNPSQQATIDFYNDNKDSICPSGRAVSHILVKDKATADAILAQLKAGAPFEQLAAEKSIDTGSAKNGGQLGCLTKGEFVKEFENASFNAPFNVPFGPVKSQYGYHIILVQPPSIDSLSNQITTALKQGAAIDRLEQTMKVRIDDPRLGTAKLVSSQQGGPPRYQVTPPTAPSPSDNRNGTPATTTTTNPVVTP